VRGVDVVEFKSYEKMSKKERKEYNNRQRKTWGALSPITRKPQRNVHKVKKQKEIIESYNQ
jgi:hypothetical protein